MKSAKVFGLGLLLALMAVSLAVPAAMAESTALCKKDVGAAECSPSDRISHTHEATLGGSQAVLETTILTVQCDVLFLGDVKSVDNSGAPLIVNGRLTYSSCNNKCVVKEENGPAEIKILKLGHETADVTGEGLIHVECGSSIDCSYNGEGLLGAAKGPLLSAETNGEVKIVAQQVKEEESYLCPDLSWLTITTTPLSSTYIATGSTATAESTALCKKDVGAAECSPSDRISHTHEATLVGSQAVLKTDILTVKCDVLFLGDVKSANNLGAPLAISGKFTFSNCNNSCVVTEENGPSNLEVLKLGHETADVTAESLIHVECGPFIDCLYTGEGLSATAKGSLLSAETNGETKITAQPVQSEEGSFFCPDESKLTIVTTPLSATYIGT